MAISAVVFVPSLSTVTVKESLDNRILDERTLTDVVGHKKAKISLGQKKIGKGDSNIVELISIT